ncbi:rilp-like protein 1, partial [Plakobranchus ocellatus]
LQAQLERIAKVNGDLRRKANTHKKQSRALLEEKVELESQLHSKDAEVDHIKKLIKEQEQYEEQREAVKAAIEASRSIEEDESVESGDRDGEPMQQQLAKAAQSGSGDQQVDEDGAMSNPSSPGFDLQGKLIIDLKDPNRPRFTLQELRQVLMERNELKTRLIEVEDELAHYKPRDAATSDAKDGDDERSSYTGEELLVYGPINKEPDEKTGSKKESGIRKLFLRMFLTGFDHLVRSDSEGEEEEEEDAVPFLSNKTLGHSAKCSEPGISETKL